MENLQGVWKTCGEYIEMELQALRWECQPEKVRVTVVTSLMASMEGSVLGVIEEKKICSRFNFPWIIQGALAAPTDWFPLMFNIGLYLFQGQGVNTSHSCGIFHDTHHTGTHIFIQH